MDWDCLARCERVNLATIHMYSNQKLVSPLHILKFQEGGGIFLLLPAQYWLDHFH